MSNSNFEFKISVISVTFFYREYFVHSYEKMVRKMVITIADSFITRVIFRHLKRKLQAVKTKVKLETYTADATVFDLWRTITRFFSPTRNELGT